MLRKFVKKLLLPLMVMCGVSAHAQVSGTVTDETGEPLIGVNIVVSGTSIGTITDFDGNFSLPDVKKGTSLTVSFLGYQTETVEASSHLNVVLKEDQKALEEVLVIGYGQVRKGDATGALVSVKTDEEAKGVTNRAQDLLQGKVAGVTILDAGGSPTGGSSIRIRGGSSLTASNDPLIVIDGVP
ncbi:MAG: carboxypeptidase-like regulatory domain-containing protein, partial [Paludibacteraceae bacterium]|nr:carboxypeptidase-like regulatory domain-containing protein [Paludibacteraceae bacterium]